MPSPVVPRGNEAAEMRIIGIADPCQLALADKADYPEYDVSAVHSAPRLEGAGL